MPLRSLLSRFFGFRLIIKMYWDGRLGGELLKRFIKRIVLVLFSEPPRLRIRRWFRGVSIIKPSDVDGLARALG